MAVKKEPQKSNVSKEELLGFYREMLLIRRFEEKAGQLYGMGLIGGFCHLYIGQEAVVVGLEACTKEGDKRITSYRDHGHMLACGMDPKGVMAELTGREGGYSKGKGGSMHMFSKEKHFYGGHGIVGAQVPLGTGLALADKYLGNDNVTFTYFGDGAANQGHVVDASDIVCNCQRGGENGTGVGGHRLHQRRIFEFGNDVGPDFPGFEPGVEIAAQGGIRRRQYHACTIQRAWKRPFECR